ncbi:hypothetical protein LRS74_30180 [Streptomyces sp. LX-29]|uniref:hypothetical protein n=1 Tax=Streptomyces sp. LX-29 TaxID=2900152 RepID=UPI00240D5640|nr:hypothetical protein [Streptomyces sp. LX-29]WFB10839.1 hypothetical protein LRS74_30180 [Streptomyces sp. LX-29]
MTMRTALRAIRAAIFAAVCTLTAALGHVLASGASVSWFSLASAFLVTAVAAWWLAGRERGVLMVTGATVAAQMGLHFLFRLLQPEEETGAPVPAHAHHHHQAAQAAHGAHHVHAGTGIPPDAFGLSALCQCHCAVGMLLLHALAALVCGLWLWRGEAAAFRLGRCLFAAVFVPLRLVLLAVAGAPSRRFRAFAMGARPVRRLRGALLQHALSRRGPPAFVAFC